MDKDPDSPRVRSEPSATTLVRRDCPAAQVFTTKDHCALSPDLYQCDEAVEGLVEFEEGAPTNVPMPGGLRKGSPLTRAMTMSCSSPDNGARLWRLPSHCTSAT